MPSFRWVRCHGPGLMLACCILATNCALSYTFLNPDGVFKACQPLRFCCILPMLSK